MIQFGFVLALEVVLGMLGMILVSAFSRHREYRADQIGADLSTPQPDDCCFREAEEELSVRAI